MSRPFFAARLEEAANRFLGGILRRLGWQERVLVYTGYGSPDFVRVLARLILVPPRSQAGIVGRELLRRRGWRNFLFTTPVVHSVVRVHLGAEPVEVATDRSGYVDVRLANAGLAPGWQDIEVSTLGGRVSTGLVQVVEREETFGIVSDIDDTIISTMLPRLLLAAWNSFVIHESARQPVPGMAALYRALLARHPGAPLVFVSTGAWYTLTRFVRHRRFPLGAMLLTDWGPTNTGWFRSGREHKERELRRLAEDFPSIGWVLVGDDGQHDPTIYSEFTRRYPDRVQAVAIRTLSSAEQMLAHGTVGSLEAHQLDRRHSVPWVVGADGWQLLPQLEHVLADKER